jgi:hypothetical protein
MDPPEKPPASLTSEGAGVALRGYIRGKGVKMKIERNGASEIEEGQTLKFGHADFPLYFLL